MSHPALQVKSQGKSIVTIGNVAPEIGEFIFEASPRVLDKIKIYQIGREVEQLRANKFDDFGNTGRFLECGVVHHDNLPWSEFRTQSSFQPNSEKMSPRMLIRIQRSDHFSRTNSGGNVGLLARYTACFSDNLDSSLTPPTLLDVFVIDAGCINENEVFHSFFGHEFPKLLPLNFAPFSNKKDF
jgi:hypothetical protein